MTTVSFTPNQASFESWIKNCETGDEAIYISGGTSSTGHHIKNVVRGAAMSALVFLYQKRNTSDPTLFDYIARRVSAKAANLARMEPFQ